VFRFWVVALVVIGPRPNLDGVKNSDICQFGIDVKPHSKSVSIRWEIIIRTESSQVMLFGTYKA
jgi:hypothetical protein